MSAPLPLPISHATLLVDDKSQPAGWESVSAILKRCKTTLIADWLTRTKKTPELNHFDLSDQQRTGHLSQLIDDIINVCPYPPCPLRMAMPASPSLPSDMAICEGRKSIALPC
jgi:hypothetical protein